MHHLKSSAAEAPEARRRSLLRASAALALLIATSQPGRARADEAVVVEGQRLPRTTEVAGAVLQLNGSGVRGVAWFKAFVAALWVAQPAHEAEALVRQGGAKRLQLRMLFDLPGAEFAKAFRKGVARNAADDAAAQALEERMQRFEQAVTALGTIKKGEVIDLDYDPRQGTLMSRNGTLRGDPLAGADFYAGLLRAFIGAQPYDEKLKAGLLGQKA